jgi:hypothetical protein
MFDSLVISSPKRNGRHQTDWEGFFPYYAGYPEAFAHAILRSADLRADAVVLDPWNGSGTTTYAASLLGLRSIGLDLNPVMVIVARARQLPPSEVDSIDPIALGIVKAARRAKPLIEATDPLTPWFSEGTAAALRAVERSIELKLLGPRTLTSGGPHLDRMSGIAAAAYVALFSVCRELVSPFRSSNPTWLRLPKGEASKITLDREGVIARFLQKLRSMADALAARADLISSEQKPAELRLQDSAEVDTAEGGVDFVLTSPPYCTRIDYAAATRVELALLDPLISYTHVDLSRQMLGSTRVPKDNIGVSNIWGERCADFLTKVRMHPSKASSGYYYKTHLDYFDKLSRSVQRLSASLRPSGAAIFVIQDSYYKDIHNDLPSIITDMAEVAGLSLRRRDDFYIKNTMSDINPHSRFYRKRSGTIEAVLCFQKEYRRQYLI